LILARLGAAVLWRRFGKGQEAPWGKKGEKFSYYSGVTEATK